MLNNAIQFHILDDEEAQQELEQQAAAQIQHRQHIGLEAFKRYVPSLVPLLTSNDPNAATILCNANGELNIVDYRSGRVLYGARPEQEIAQHLMRALVVNKPIRIAPQSDQNESLMVLFGLGLGHQVPIILDKHKPNHLIIYEPNTAYLKCSLAAVDWRAIFHQAQQQGTALYLQMGKDGRDLFTDVQELAQHYPVTIFSWYKHFNHPVFDQVVRVMTEKPWSVLSDWFPNLAQLSSVTSYVEPWTLVHDETVWSDRWLDEEKKQRNLAAIKLYFPSLYDEFHNYQPLKWLPVANRDGEVNILYQESGALFYGDSPVFESEENLEHFKRRPNKDGLVLGYSGQKLKRYLHYQLVAECEKVLKDIEELKSQLPSEIKSLIFFGIAAGYHLERLLEQHLCDNLFICEPNRDYFYCSLYAISWDRLIQQIDKNSGRLYFNIGDDGSHLVEDLLTQFQSVGPYILTNTFFYQGYYNDRIAGAVAQLREQLQVMIAMGDYFDHARYGISHTRVVIDRGVPFLLKNASDKMPQAYKDVPVFVVGNGPSLDNLVDVIKAEKDKVIIISCGTALQTLYKHGITPDFHAEIEMNRATFDWCARVGDFEYLKKICLISCNGIHPDTCDLFGSVLLAFKQGEAATVSTFELNKHHLFAVLEHAYPTVSNFAVDLLTTIGFSQIYLFGVDMGFVDPEHHHSKTSGYYTEEGKQRYEYVKRENTQLVIKGNLRPFVNTKYEFKIAKSVLEQTLRKNSKNTDAYNPNDGAYIHGAKPLSKESILILSESDAKHKVLEFLHANVFVSAKKTFSSTLFLDKFSKAVLLDDLQRLIDLNMNEASNQNELNEKIGKQRALLVDSLRKGNSLSFFYLNGSVNYINAIFGRFVAINEFPDVLPTLSTVERSWKEFLFACRDTLEVNGAELDGTFAFNFDRRSVFLNQYKDSLMLDFGCFNQALRNSPPFWQRFILSEKNTQRASNAIKLNFMLEAPKVKVIDDAVSVLELNKLVETMTKHKNGQYIVFENDFYRDKDLQLANNFVLHVVIHAASFQKYDYILGYFPINDESFKSTLCVVARNNGFIYPYIGPDFFIYLKHPLANQECLTQLNERLVYASKSL